MMEYRYRYRSGIHLHPLPPLQSDVRPYRRTPTVHSPLAPEHHLRHHRRRPLPHFRDVPAGNIPEAAAPTAGVVNKA